jgi:D-alanyl-D-alanine carboxypeptidase/D-alanyl-D-alanine-endopeptidase (penicillin-binding protein 4)
VTGATPPHVKILAVHYSKPLSNILSYMLKYSDDVYANALIKTIGYAYYNVGSYQKGVLAANTILMSHIGKNFRPFHLADGSGLSVADALSPEQLVQILHYMFHNPNLANLFIRSLPISGEGGTLVYRLTMHPFRDHVYAKTGTFEHDKGGVSSLSGYLILPHRPAIAFAIMMNHLSGNMFHAQHLQDEIVTQLAKEN